MSAHAAFRAAVEARDSAAMTEAMAPDATLDSPVSFKPFVGREDIGRLFAILMETFEDFSYTDELEADGKTALVFRARVGDREVQGLDLMRFDDEGRITQLTVMVRPLSGVIALAEAVGPKLAAA